MIIDDIEVTGDIPEAEAREYVKRAPAGTYAMNLTARGEFVDIEYRYCERVPFERIRRITGYLVGTMDRWNDAKTSEEADRVKHRI